MRTLHTLLSLLALQLLVACGDEPKNAQGTSSQTPKTDAVSSSDSASNSDSKPKDLLGTLLTKRRPKEPIFVCPSPAADKIAAALEGQGIEIKLPRKNVEYPFYLNKMIPQVRRHGSLWVVHDHTNEELSGILDVNFFQREKVSFQQKYDTLTLSRVENNGAGEASRVKLTKVTTGGGMITNIEFTPDGEFVFFSSKGGVVRWASRTNPKQKGILVKLPTLDDGPPGVFSGGESGLIGMALHPEFESNRKLYLQYNLQRTKTERAALITEWRVDMTAGKLAAVDQRIILELEQTRDNHNAGALEFGPDGMLYIAVGDGQQGKFTEGRSPRHTIRGKVLRIDVNRSEGNKAYAIPADNPFVGDDGTPPETWAWGLRNPWRMAFTPDGRLIAGEIGADTNEEITLIKRGKHHGWPYFEGLHNRNPWTLGDNIPIEPPLFAYPRDLGMSVIGGHVYGGSAMPWLQGKYVFSDFLSGRIWMLDLPPLGEETTTRTVEEVTQIGRWPLLMTTFGQDPDGNIYVGGHNGTVYRLDESDGGAIVEEEAATLNYGVVQSMLGTEFAGAQRAEASEAEVALGQKLYHEASISSAQGTSCATCHPLDNWGQDGLQVAKSGRRNTPSTFNAHRQFAQFWDYRAPSVEELGNHSLLDNDKLVSALRATDYATDFGSAFAGDADPVTATNARLAIGAFVRSLTTRSRFDDFLDGNQSALTEAEQTGLAEFVAVGCVTCHQYRTLGGGLPQKLGLTQVCDGEDKGRAEVSGVETDTYLFKVSPLLNVAKTAPYYHDGSIPTLAGAVRHMAKVQLGRDLSDAQTKSIVTFLNALTGKR